MTRRVVVLALVAAGLLALVPAAALAATSPSIVEVGRVNFPDRAFVLTLPKATQLAPGEVTVSENGQPVVNLQVTPAEQAKQGKFGTVLVLDTSASMLGRPLKSALAAARAFAAKRPPAASLGVVAFNRSVQTILAPTTDAVAIQKALATSPKPAVGTHIMDGVSSAVSLLEQGKFTVGTVVLLSDGRDTGSKLHLKDVVGQAGSAHIRVFTVGLRSYQFRPSTLRNLATATDAAYAEASSPAALAPIYSALSARLSSEYLVQYKSLAGPNDVVNVDIQVTGLPGAATSAYQTPALPPRILPPYHRSAWDRFWLSGWSIAVVSIIAGLLAAVAALGLLRGGRFPLRQRMEQFVLLTRSSVTKPESQVLTAIDRALAEKGWWRKFKYELEVADFRYTAPQLVLMTLAAIVVLGFILVITLPPIFAIFALIAPPLITHTIVQRKLKSKRDAFADQLADNLNILASALRVGHSFVGALSVMVEEADEPSKSEFRRALNDEQLGVPVEDALLVVAERMASSDLEQVALVAALQRQTGGNTAEVLDTVVDTIRERADVRRLVQTLTAQGRVARWILTAIPLVLLLAVALIDPAYLHPLFHRSAGQALLVLAALMVTAGSYAIKRIVEIKV